MVHTKQPVVVFLLLNPCTGLLGDHGCSLGQTVRRLRLKRRVHVLSADFTALIGTSNAVTHSSSNFATWLLCVTCTSGSRQAALAGKKMCGKRLTRIEFQLSIFYQTSFTKKISTCNPIQFLRATNAGRQSDGPIHTVSR